mgnify:CR=1 FL=1
MFQHDPFENVGHVFTSIGPRLERFVNLFPLNDGDRVGLLLKQAGDGITRDAVRFILQTVHFHTAFVDLRMGHAHPIDGFADRDEPCVLCTTIDEEGFITIVGRKSDLIICAGKNVYAAEVERAIEGYVTVVAGRRLPPVDFLSSMTPV